MISRECFNEWPGLSVDEKLVYYRSYYWHAEYFYAINIDFDIFSPSRYAARYGSLHGPPIIYFVDAIFSAPHEFSPGRAARDAMPLALTMITVFEEADMRRAKRLAQ